MNAVDNGIVGVPSPPIGRRMLVLWAVIWVGGLSYGIVKHEWFLAVYSSIMAVSRLGRASRPATVVNAAGVRRPWRRPAFLSWNEVASVPAPQPGVFGVRLRLVNGKQVSLYDIPSDRSAAVAAIGGKDLLPLSQPKLALPPARRRTDEDVLADVTREAQALARQRQELAALARQLKP